VRRALAPRVPERVGEDQPALGVGVGHLDGEAGGGRDHVRRPDGVGADHVLARRDDAEDGDRQRQLGDRAERGEHRRAAGHVALLAHDVGLGLEEVAARVEGDGLADQREPRPLGRARRLVAQDDEPRRRCARAAHGGERREAGREGIEHVDPQAGERGRALGQCRGRDEVRRPVDELAGDVRPLRAQRGARRDLAKLGVPVARAADDEALDAACGSVALPATRAVAAEERALDDRPHLPVQGERQRLVQRPGDRAAAVMRTHRPGCRRPQVLRILRVERDHGDPLRTQLAADVHHGDRVGVSRRPHQPALEAPVELSHEKTARCQGEDVGLHLGGVGSYQLDGHRGHSRLLSPGARGADPARPSLGSGAGGVVVVLPARHGAFIRDGRAASRAPRGSPGRAGRRARREAPCARARTR
jgi:hypothetical protein